MVKTKFRVCNEVYTLFSHEEEDEVHFEVWKGDKVIKYSCKQYAMPEYVVEGLSTLLMNNHIFVFINEVRELVKHSALKSYFEILS